MAKKYKNLGSQDKNDDGVLSVDELHAISQEVVSAERAEAPKEELVDFDTWYSLREKDIPGRHYKEIIKADFKAQKVGEMASMTSFDKALKKYGVKLA